MLTSVVFEGDIRSWLLGMMCRLVLKYLVSLVWFCPSIDNSFVDVTGDASA